MSMITELTKRLRKEADGYKGYRSKRSVRVKHLLREAADTIEALSEKVRTANMEGSTAYYRLFLKEVNAYKKAFEIACDLLSGSILFGIDKDSIFAECLEKDRVVTSESYEKYILNNLERLEGKGK